jgi:hypothetical protein
MLLKINFSDVNPLWLLQNSLDSTILHRLCTIDSSKRLVTAGKTLMGLVLFIAGCSVPVLLNKISLASMK